MPQKAQTTASPSRGTLMWVLGIALSAIIVLVGAMLLGRSDKGAIDVSATIANSNQERVENGQAPIEQPATQAYQNMPNGGLVPSGAPETPQAPQPEEAASTTASTTPETDDTAETAAEGVQEDQTENAEEPAASGTESETPVQ